MEIPRAKKLLLKIDLFPDLCIREVPYEIEIEVPCGETTCKKTVTKNRSVTGPCWADQAQEDSLFNNGTNVLLI